ncbi:hypothetical protein Tco_0887839 [Tanacetum coccineum]
MSLVLKAYHTALDDGAVLEVPLSKRVKLSLEPFSLEPASKIGLVEGDHHEEKVNENRKIHNFTPELRMTPIKEISTNRESKEEDESMDISKITRKPSKTGKHGHGERKSTKEAKDAKPKPGKVYLESTLGQPQSKH